MWGIHSALFIAVVFLLLVSLLSLKLAPNSEKASPYECGFAPMSTERTPYPLRYFLLSILFVIFDVEILLLLPSLEQEGPRASVKLFIFILLVGLYHEWRMGALEWEE